MSKYVDRPRRSVQSVIESRDTGSVIESVVVIMLCKSNMLSRSSFNHSIDAMYIHASIVPGTVVLYIK